MVEITQNGNFRSKEEACNFQTCNWFLSQLVAQLRKDGHAMVTQRNNYTKGLENLPTRQNIQNCLFTIPSSILTTKVSPVVTVYLQAYSTVVSTETNQHKHISPSELAYPTNNNN